MSSLELRQDAVAGIRCFQYGRGTPALFCIHGFGDGAYIWSHILANCTVRGSAFAVDLRGHGHSVHDYPERYTVRQHAADVIATLEQLKPSPLVLIGHSMGAATAIRVAAACPQRVGALVLVDGGPGLNPQAMDHMRSAFAAQPWSYRCVEDYVTVLTSRMPMVAPSLVESAARGALLEDADGSWRLRCDRRLIQAERSTYDELWGCLPRICCPVLLLRGAWSGVLLPHIADRIRKTLPQCTLRTVPAAGHAIMLENPGALCEGINDFLERCVNAGGCALGAAT